MKIAPKILLVDDDRQLLDFMRKVLDASGYDVHATSSGKKALEMIHQSRPDLLILDLNMPEPDGFDILKIERTQAPLLRILVVSGYLRGEILEVAKYVGAIATMQKPFGADALVKKVREVLGE